MKRKPKQPRPQWIFDYSSRTAFLTDLEDPSRTFMVAVDKLVSSPETIDAALTGSAPRHALPLLLSNDQVRLLAEMVPEFATAVSLLEE